MALQGGFRLGKRRLVIGSLDERDKIQHGVRGRPLIVRGVGGQCVAVGVNLRIGDGFRAALAVARESIPVGGDAETAKGAGGAIAVAGGVVGVRAFE